MPKPNLTKQEESWAAELKSKLDESWGGEDDPVIRTDNLWQSIEEMADLSLQLHNSLLANGNEPRHSKHLY